MLIEKMELTDYSKYQMDFLLFKNEVLKLLNKHEEKQKKKENEDRNKYEDISKSQEEHMKRFAQRITELSNTRYVEQAKLDKIESIHKKQESLTESVSVNSIRLATCQKELGNAVYKYDKIFLENLTVPGLVGNYCKHKNLREFIQFAQDNITNLIQTKGKDQAALQVYKDNIDLLIKQFSLKFDSILKQTFGYTKDAFIECTDNYKKAVQEIYDKMDSVRLENSKYAVTFKSQNEEFSKDLEVIKGVKVDLLNKMSNTLTIIESRNKDFSEKYDHMKKTFETITSELKKHTITIEGLNQTINELKGNPNRTKSIANPNNFKERKGSRDNNREKDKEALNNNNNIDLINDDNRLKNRVIEIINEYYLSGSYGKEQHSKKMDFKKNGNMDVESNLKKYIKGEITTEEFGPSQRKRGSSFANLIKKSNNVGSPQVNEDHHPKNANIPNLNLEEEKENHSVSECESNSSSPSHKSDSLIKLNSIKPKHSNDKDKDSKDNKQQSKNQPKPNVSDKSKSTNNTSTNSKRKKLSIAISSKDELIPKIKSSETLQNDDKDSEYSNILNWKINMKNKIMPKEAKDKAKTERGKDLSKDTKKESNQEMTKKSISTSKDNKLKEYTGRFNNIDFKNDMLTIREYEYNGDDNKVKPKCKSKDSVRDINIKASLYKEQEQFLSSSNAFNSNSKHKREISQESAFANFHYPYIESLSTPHTINPSKSEAKYFFNKTYNARTSKCQSAKRDEGNIFDNVPIKSSVNLSKDQIEKKLIEIEYFTKKKFDELVTELQKYIPLNFKSHTRYRINEIGESIETQRRNKTPNEIEYENDLRHAKISIVTSEVLEKAGDNGAFRSLFPKKSPKYQGGGDKKGLSSFRKLQQGAKDKEKEKEKKSSNNKTQLFGGNNSGYSINSPSCVNNLKEMNLSEASSYVALNKLFTNMPKSSTNMEDKNGAFPFDGY